MAAKKSTFTLEWRGDELSEAYRAALTAGLAAWGLVHEQTAKAQLAPGHGLLTGRGQKSIHAAKPDHDFASDFKAPARSMPELGGRLVMPEDSGDRLTIAVGTGIFYMQIIEGRFMFMARSHDQSIGRLEGEIESAAAGVE